MSHKSEKVIQGIILIAACAALVLTALNIKAYQQQIRRLEQRQHTLAELAAIEQRQVEREEILTHYEHFQKTQRKDVRSLLAEFQQEGSPENTPLFAGWELEEATWRAQNIELAKLSSLFAGFRELRPPWAVQSCRIIAADQSGRGDVTLTVQTIYRP